MAVGDSPKADTGAVGVEVEAGVEFAGDGAVGTRRLGGERFGGQGRPLGWPVGVRPRRALSSVEAAD